MLVLTLHYPMTCGQQGPVLVLTLPSGFRTGLLKAALNGRQAPVSHHGGTVQVTLPKPPPVTCMSITEGTLRVSLAGLHASSGIYSLTAQADRHLFRAAVRVG